MYTLQFSLEHAIDHLFVWHEGIKEYYTTGKDGDKYSGYILQNEDLYGNEFLYSPWAVNFNIGAMIVGVVQFAYIPSTKQYIFLYKLKEDLEFDLVALKEYANEKSKVYGFPIIIARMG